MNEPTAHSVDGIEAARRKPALIRPLALATIVGAGALVAWFAALMLAVSIYSAFDQREVERSREVVVREDGEPLLRTYGLNGYEYLTLDSKPAPESEFRILHAAALPPESERALTADFSASLSVLSQRFDDGERARWYLLYDSRKDGSGWLEGFDLTTRHRIGYISRSGFRRDMPPAEDRFRFDHSPQFFGRHAYQYAPAIKTVEGKQRVVPQRVLYFMADGGVVSVDLRTRVVRSILRSPDVAAISLFPGYFSDTGGSVVSSSPQSGPGLAVRLQDRIVVVENGQVRETIRLPDGLDEKWISLFWLGPTSAVLAVEDTLRSDQVELIYVSASGEATRRQMVRVRPPAPPESFWDRSEMGAVVPIPAVMLAGIMAAPMIESEKPPIERLSKAIAEFWPALMVAVLASAAMAWYAWRRLNRFGMPYPRTWTVFVFILGLPGLCGLLFHRRWPVREPCPSCGRLSPRDRDACFDCREPFPVPPPKGIEVFA